MWAKNADGANEDVHYKSTRDTEIPIVYILGHYGGKKRQQHVSI